MTTRTLNISNGQSLQPDLGFMAQGVYVDNPGGQWVRFPSVNAYCPPYFTGWSVPFPVGTQNPLVDTIPPVGLFVNPSGNPAVLRFTDDVVPESAGALLQQQLQANAFSKCYTINSASANPTTDMLTFFAQYVTVDNNGGQWITVGGRTIAPFIQGAVIVLPAATKSVSISTTPPSGQVNLGGGQAAQICYTDLQQAASGGTPSAQSLTESVPLPQISATAGPALANSQFGMAVGNAFGVLNEIWLLCSLSIKLLPAASGALGNPWYCSLSYGPNAGSGSILWFAAGGTGAGSGPGGPSPGGTGCDLTFATDARPPFTIVNGSQIYANFIQAEGNNFGANNVRGVVSVVVKKQTI